MNTTDITSNLAQSIGWTLLHTLWQAPLIYIVLIIINRALGEQKSAARYGVGVAALASSVAAAVITFVVLISSPANNPEQITITSFSAASQITTFTDATFSLQTILQWVDVQLVWVLRFWVVGFVFYLLRLVAGLWYVNRLKSTAVSLGSEWNDVVRQLASDLKITRVITMAEAKITSPMVVGYLKPVILFPIGLVSGLSHKQVETILLHELSHIRRHDYLVNLFQVATEALLFFNPFVWMISSEIRREREHCCDDMVIEKGIDPLSYAKTLADLETSAGNQLVLGIAGHQNELLNRIKRIMQKSAKNDWSNGRLLPASLVVLGLVLASWLSIENSDHGNLSTETVAVVAQDTTKPAKRKRAETEQEGTPAEAPSEDREAKTFTFRSNPNADWEKFEEEFNEKFKSQFGDFFKKNEKEIAKMMEELRGAYENGNGVIMMDPKLMEELEHLKMFTPAPFPGVEIPDGEWEESMAALSEIDIPLIPLEELEALRGDAWHQAELAATLNHEAIADAMEAADLAMKAREWEMSSDILDELKAQELWAVDANLKVLDEEMKAYEEAVHQMLIDDGYIKKDAPWTGININVQENEITINNIKIKKQHLEKYNALHDKHFQKTKTSWIRKTE